MDISKNEIKNLGKSQEEFSIIQSPKILIGDFIWVILSLVTLVTIFFLEIPQKDFILSVTLLAFFILATSYIFKLIKVLLTEFIFSDTQMIIKNRFTKTLRPLEYQKIIDHDYDPPFWYQLFTMTRLRLKTSDSSDPYVTIDGINANGEELAALINSIVRNSRRKSNTTTLQ